MQSRLLVLYAAVGLAGFSAVVHLSLGLAGLIEMLIDGTSSLRPLLFLVAAILVYALIGGLFLGHLVPRTAYAMGAIIMVAYVVAYADWHAFGVAESVLGLEESSHDHDGHGDHSHDDGHDHAHDGPAHQVLLDHLRADPLALATKTRETLSALAFMALYVRSDENDTIEG